MSINYNNSTFINGNLVQFKVKEGEVSFLINEKHERKEENTNHKVAITRWLLKEWEKVKDMSFYFTTRPYCEDGFGEMRTKIFQKLGFKPSKDNKIKLEWGTFPYETLPYSYSNNRLRVNFSKPEAEFLEPMEFPYREHTNGLIVHTSYPEEGWAKAEEFPYQVARGILRVIKNLPEWGWMRAEHIPS